MSYIRSHSGIRGIYGKQLTPLIAYKLANKFAEQFKLEKVVIGRDTRKSGLPIKHAIISGFLTAGANVIDVDIAPTPAILYSIKKFNADGGAIISASHNPPEWNAIKLASKNGLLLTSNEAGRVLDKIDEEEYVSSKPGKIVRINIIDDYIEELIKHVNIEAIRKYSFKVVVDAGGGAGSLSTPKLISKLDCKVFSINSTPGVFTRKIEPVGEALDQLKLAVKSVNADIGFAHDCDADRLVIVDEMGREVREDYGIAVAVNHELSKTSNKKLVVNIASSMVFRDIANKHNAEIFWSKVGESNVVRMMIKVNSDIGAEGSSGGLILKKFHYARDGALAAIKILEAMAENNKKISELISELPKYYLAKKSIQFNLNKFDEVKEKIAKKWEGIGEIIFIDGVKVIGDNWWILIRPSRTEPILRLMAEAENMNEAKKLLDECIKIAKQ